MALLRGFACAFALALPLSAQVSTSERVRAVLAREDCQTSLPGEPPSVGADEFSRQPSNSGVPHGRMRRTEEPRSWRGIAMPSWFGSFLLWIGIAVVVSLLLAVIVEAVRDRSKREVTKKKERVLGAAVPQPLEVVEAGLADPDRLAEAGDYAAAVHALLHRAIRGWQDRGEFVPAHATAREVLRAVRRKGRGVSAFATLVGAVELAVFGGREVDKNSYEHSRASLAEWEDACREKRTERLP
ncbi:MAG: DUF4129 domain-containing protein [Planctomycetota bacterium]